MKSQSSQSEQNNSKSNSSFAYENSDDGFIFQSKQLFMQLQFRTPIKQFFDYLQQYQKYYFFSEITSIGIKASMEKSIYEAIQASIDKSFKTYLQKSVSFIQEILMNLYLFKCQKWHKHSQIIKAYKNNILGNFQDCYEYKCSQFQQQLREMMTKLDYNQQKNNKDLKTQLKNKKQQIKLKLNDIRENSFVKHPFTPKNSKGFNLQPNAIFQSYLKQVAFKTSSFEEAINLRFNDSFKKLRQFPQFMKQYSLKCQKMSHMIIQRYNRFFNPSVTSVQQILQKQENMSLDQQSHEWRKQINIFPSLRNKFGNVVISSNICCIQQNKQGKYTYIETKLYQNNKSKQMAQNYQNRIPANNPYFDFWCHTYDRQKLRKLQYFYEQPKIIQETQNKQQYYVNSTPKTKKRTKRYNNIYFNLIQQRREDQQNIFKQSSKYLDEKVTKIRHDTTQVKIIYNQADNQTYQKYTCKEQDLKQIRFKKGRNNKNYRQFLSMIGVKQNKIAQNESQVFRYGISIHKAIHQNNEPAKLQQFLCNFLKQKIFMQTNSIQSKQQIPLILNVKSAEQFSNWRVVKKLGQLTLNFKKYYIWASQIIKYEQIMLVNKQIVGHFTIYTYTESRNSQAILFQLKRRLNMRISGQVINKYNIYQINSINSILSKLQLMHRLMFNRHEGTQSHEPNCTRGALIFKSIIKCIEQISKTNEIE